MTLIQIKISCRTDPQEQQSTDSLSPPSESDRSRFKFDVRQNPGAEQVVLHARRCELQSANIIERTERAIVQASDIERVSISERRRNLWRDRTCEICLLSRRRCCSKLQASRGQSPSINAFPGDMFGLDGRRHGASHEASRHCRLSRRLTLETLHHRQQT
jgi:hypothetical protein